MKPIKCPAHNRIMISNNTQYGLRFACPVDDCTYVAWIGLNGAKSKPANLETRNARIKAHNAFDSLWKSGRYKRRLMYSALATFLGKKAKKVHIRLFDIETCNKVHEFVAKF